MTEYIPQRFASALARSSWLWWTCLFLLLALGPTSVVLSQENYFSNLGDRITDADEAQSGMVYSDEFTGRSGRAFGVLVRGGYLTGPAIGREKGLAPLELMPYMFLDRGMIFGDLRGFRSDNDQYGANMGGGYRHYVDALDRIFGVNFFADYDNTSGVLFRQWGFGIETYGQAFDARANAYFPYGTRSQFLGASLNQGSQTFVGNNLVYSITNRFGASLRGADAEFGIPIPGPWSERHDLRVYAGGYTYDSSDTGSFAGWSGRLQGNPIPSLQLQLAVTNDRLFDTNVVFSAAFSYGGFRQNDGERKSQFGRMTTPVQRQYNIAVARTDVLVDGLLAVNPVNGLPYFFKHVASYAAPGGTGTFENPFQTINQTTPNVPGDIVFVHGNSVFTGALNPTDNVLAMEAGTSTLPVRYLGDGLNIVHRVNVATIGPLDLPSGTTGANRPQLLNGIGNGVTLANFAEFSGFSVGDPNVADSGPTGDAVFGGLFLGNPVHDVVLTQNIFAESGGNGLHFDNAGANIFMFNNVVTNPDGIGMLVENGAPQVRFGVDAGLPLQVASITNTGDVGLLVRNTLAGSNISLTGSTLDNTDSSVVGRGQGILIDTVAGSVSVGNVTIRTPDSFGIKIDNLSGNFSGNGQVQIAGATDNALDITNLASTGSVIFASSTAGGGVTITGRNQIGVNMVGNGSGTIDFNGPVTISGIVAGTAFPAINWQGNATTTSFDGGISIVDSGTDGIDLGTVTPNTGSFTTNGPVGISGTIGNIGIQIANNTVASSVGFGGSLNIDGRTNQGIFIHDNAGTVSFTGNATVQNELLSIAPAVDIERNTGGISFATLTIIDGTSAGTDGYGAGLNVIDNPAQVVISEAQITTFDGIGVFVAHPVIPADDVFQIASGRVSSSGLPAIDISDSVYNVTLTQVDSDTSAREGIRLFNNTGIGSLFDFSILGNGNTVFSGGTINNSADSGIYAELAGSLSINNMLIDGNFTGVETIDLPRLDLVNNQISNSTRDGLLAIDNRIVNVIGLGQDGFLNFDNNGSAPDFHAINLVAQFNTHVTPNGQFFWTLRNNQIVHNSGNAAVLATNRGFPAANNANLTFRQTLDEITITAPTPTPVPPDVALPRTSASGTTIDWTGTTDVLLQQNTFTLAGGSQFGIVFNAFSSNTANFSNVQILSNVINAFVGNNTAIYASSVGAANIVIDRAPNLGFGNIITMNDGLNFNGRDRGIDIDRIGAGSSVVIANTNLGANANQGFILSDFATAINFGLITAPSSVTIDNNTFTMAPVTQGAGELGINLGSIIGGTLQINGGNNTINNPQQTFLTDFLPFTNPGNINGTITVNGINYPQ